MTMKINITAEERRDLIEAIHANAVAKGFWAEIHSEDHYKMLVITELSEAVEAHRKDEFAKREDYQDVLDINGADFDSYHFEAFIKDTVEDELADALIRIYDIMGAYEFNPLEATIAGKRNRTSHKFVEHTSEFTVQVLLCIKSLLNESYLYMLCDYAIGVIEAVAEHNGIDLYWHVREKMRYNATRPPLHGKKY